MARKKITTRAEIIKAATEMFLENGYIIAGERRIA